MIRFLKNKKGNALITAIITFTVLLIIAIGMVTLSVTSVSLSSQMKEHNNAYYVAEAAVGKGVQMIKDQTADYYTQMREAAEAVRDLGASTDAYDDLYDNFFTNIVNNAAASFQEPDFTQNGYENATTSTSFSLENENGDTADMVVESTSLFNDGTKRTVRSVVNLQRMPMLSTSSTSGTITINPSKGALTVGGDFIFNISTSPTQIFRVQNGGAEVGGYQNKNNANKYIQMLTSGYNVTVTPGLGATISDPVTYSDLLKYKSSTVTRYITASTPATWADQGSSTDPRYLEGVDGLSCTLSSGSFYGQVYCKGNLTITNGNYYGNIFCEGNVNLNGAQVKGNIVAKGDINISGGTYGGTVIDGKLVDGVFFAGNNVNINNGGTLVKAYVYAKNNFNMNSNPAGAAVIFAANDIVVTVSNTFAYTGTMMAKRNFVLTSSASCWHTLSVDSAFADQVQQNTWYSTFFSSKAEVLDIDVNEIIQKEVIYEK